MAQDLPLIGFTANPATPSSNITTQRLCDTPATVCANALPSPGAAEPWAGGAAFSPFRNSVWHTQGTRLQELPLDGCQPICSRDAVRILGTDSRASGLAIDVARGQLFQLETTPGRGGIVTYRLDPTSACPLPVNRCDFFLPSTLHHAGAIAFDQQRRVLYVATSRFNMADPQTFLYVFRADLPTCDPFCRVQVTDCFTGRLQAVRAATYDECKDRIYLSDGRQTSVQDVIWGSAGCPVLRPRQCCPLAHPAGELWAGFDLQSRAPIAIGTSCLSRPCTNCPSMALSANGVAAIGNGQFQLLITGAPSNSTGFIILGAGPCTRGVPYSCGRLLPALAPPPVVAAVPLPGLGACGGRGSLPVPVPNSLGLCDAALCAQAIVLCPTGGIGLTNALQVEVTP